MPKRLLIVGAGAYQHYIYKTARKLGLWVCGVDGDPNAAMFNLCDEYHIVDFSQTRGVVDLAKRLRIDAVATINLDQGMNSVVAIQQALGMRHISPESILAATRKDHMRNRWKIAGLRQPPFWVFKDTQKSEIHDLISASLESLIIKPVDNAAKRGIAFLDRQDPMLFDQIENAFRHSKVKKVIVEQKVEGTLIFAATYLSETDARVSLMKQSTVEGLVQSRFDAPFSFGDKIDKAVIAEALLAARCFGLGPFHTEMIVSKEGRPYLIETSPRVSYATVALSRLIEGFDPVHKVLCDAFGEAFPAVTAELGSAEAARLQHLQPIPGSIFRGRAGKQIRVQGLYEIVPLVRANHQVRNFRTNSDRVLYFTVYGSTLAAVEHLTERLAREIDSRYFLVPT